MFLNRKMRENPPRRKNKMYDVEMFLNRKMRENPPCLTFLYFDMAET